MLDSGGLSDPQLPQTIQDLEEIWKKEKITSLNALNYLYIFSYFMHLVGDIQVYKKAKVDKQKNRRMCSRNYRSYVLKVCE